MIVRVNYQNLHQYGEAFVSHFRLRHECFIDRQNYNVSNWRGMEYDQYDTPATTYIVYLDQDGAALGSARLTPVTQGSMLRDLWPHLVRDADATYRGNVWEGTRLCARKDLPSALRRTIRHKLVLGYMEAALEEGVERIIGVMPPLIFRSVFIAPGCRYAFLGEPGEIPSGETIVAAAIEVSEAALAEVRQKTGILQPVIQDWQPPALKKAA